MQSDTTMTSVLIEDDKNQQKPISCNLPLDEIVYDSGTSKWSSFEEPFSDSGSEYIPGSDEREEEYVIPRTHMKKTKVSCTRTQVNNNFSNAGELDLLPPESINVHVDIVTSSRNNIEVCTEEQSQPESFWNQEEEKHIPNLNLDKTRKDDVCLAIKTAGKRMFDKKHACMYCKILVSKLPRHLEAKHKNEKEVAQFMAKSMNSKERKAIIESIRQTGNYQHNSQVITSGTGLVIPKRRPDSSKNIKDFTPCGYCHGFFDKKYIYAHKRQCAVKNNVNVNSKGCGKLTFPVAEEDACKGLQQDVLSKMRQDSLYHVVRADSLILRFGSELHNRLGNLEHLHVYIAQRMRQLARYLTEIRNINNEIYTLADSLHPKYYNDFVKAVKCLGKYNQETGTYGVPTLPLRLRTSIQQCAAIYKSDLIINGQTGKRAQLDDFVSLIEMNYKNQVSSQALNSSYKSKWNKPDIIPLASDISLLSSYLKGKAEIYVSEMKKGIDAVTWIKLCEVTLVQILLFNRRRSDEVERMFLETYINRDSSEVNEELENTLTDLEKQIAKNFTRIEVRGIRGRKVPILLTNDMKMQVDLLVEKREAVGVAADNPYLFANLNALNHMRSSDKLRDMAEKSGVKNTNIVTSTKLCKHVASAAQLLNLKEKEMDSLATYMGHDIRVHRQYYRLPDGVTQLAKVSKLLLAMDNGNLVKNKNKNSDNMEIYGCEENICNEPLDNICHEPLDNICNEPLDNICNGPQQERPDLKRNTRGIPKENNKKEPKTKKKGGKIQKVQRPHKRVTWTPKEKDAMNREMAVFWLRKKVPNKEECEACLAQEPDLGRRSWRDVKNYVYKVYQSKLKIL